MLDPIWICKDGRRLKVAQMDDHHLRAAIAMIERSRRWRKCWLARLYLELEMRSQGLRT